MHMLAFLLWALQSNGRVSAGDTLEADSYQSCSLRPAINVTDFGFKLFRSNQSVFFTVTGTNAKTTNVIADIKISAYGVTATQMTFDPCEYKIGALCPLKAGPFHEAGTVAVPDYVGRKIPEIAWRVPDLQGLAKVTLRAKDGDQLACLETIIGNRETTQRSAARIATVGLAVGAVALSGVASIAGAGGLAASGSGVGVGTAGSPSIMQLANFFMDVAWSGALSVNTPQVYVSFTQNFAWSNGLVVVAFMQRGIDNFRGKTGGDINKASYDLLRHQQVARSSQFQKRDGASKIVTGIEAYVEELKIPSQNTFMTLFITFMSLLGAIVVGCLLTKVVLELWSRKGTLPKALESFRVHFWQQTTGLLVRTILIIYGTWTLLCLYQFKNGDSWAASVLAGASLFIFTAIIFFFTIQIVRIARHAKQSGAGMAELYEDKPKLRKYGFLYEEFRKEFWWFFVPCILYSVAKACFIALGDGHGLIQVVGQLAVEGLMIAFLFVTRAYDGTKANVVNVAISIVRILTLVGTLIFVDVLGIAEKTRSVAAIVMIAVQSVLTIILAILLIYNAVLPWIRSRKQKRAKRLSRHMEEGLPLKQSNPSRVSLHSETISLETIRTRNGVLYEPVEVHRELAETGYKRPFVDGAELEMTEKHDYYGPTGNSGVRASEDVPRPSIKLVSSSEAVKPGPRL